MAYSSLNEDCLFLQDGNNNNYTGYINKWRPQGNKKADGC